MKLFHGSDTVIETIDLNKCRPAKDFGQGFYVTKYLRQAEEMAIRVSRWGNGNPYVTELEFNEYAFRDSDFKTLRFNDYSEEWLDFIILNRNNIEGQQVHDYDIVEGPVADDDITTRIFDYLRGNVSKKDFIQELRFKKPMHQICFCSVQSLQMLTIINEDDDGKFIHIDDDIVRTLMIDFGWSETHATSTYYDSKTWCQLTNDTNGFTKKPWKDIYRMLLKELKLKK
jgi:hypothetical protein